MQQVPFEKKKPETPRRNALRMLFSVFAVAVQPLSRG